MLSETELLARLGRIDPNLPDDEWVAAAKAAGIPDVIYSPKAAKSQPIADTAAVAAALHHRDQSVADATVKALSQAGYIRDPSKAQEPPIQRIEIVAMPDRVKTLIRDKAGKPSGAVEADA